MAPPTHTLTQWEREFVAKNREDVYDLLLVSVCVCVCVCAIIILNAVAPDRLLITWI